VARVVPLCWPVRLAVEQVKLEFRCHDDTESHFFQRRDRPLQNGAWIGKVGLATFIEHPEQSLRSRSGSPRHGRDTSGYKAARSVGIAVCVSKHAWQNAAESTH
jgi:hypothetical protein